FPGAVLARPRARAGEVLGAVDAAQPADAQPGDAPRAAPAEPAAVRRDLGAGREGVEPAVRLVVAADEPHRPREALAPGDEIGKVAERRVGGAAAPVLLATVAL